MRIFFLLAAAVTAQAALFAQDASAKNIHLFTALCDNEAQGIVPVPEKIGNGDDPDSNLYWGCSEGVKGIFKNAEQWTLIEEPAPPKPCVLRRMIFKHKKFNAILTADAYKGTEIGQCLEDFELAASSGDCHLAAYIGHNGLMDFDLPESAPQSSKPPAECIVLCCKSAQYFQSRIERFGAKPRLLTTQFMYPGAFLLRDALDTWLNNGDNAALREAAAKAYANNQKISLKAARGVFATIGTKEKS